MGKNNVFVYVLMVFDVVGFDLRRFLAVLSAKLCIGGVIVHRKKIKPL